MNVEKNERSGVVAAAAPAQASMQDDPQLIAALEEYLTALESGQRLDRQEFLARHTAIAGELAEYLDSLEFVQIAAPRLHPAVSPPSLLDAAEAEPSAAKQLGDYRILREVGRGGMGVVYEAEQLSLGRRVALKVLPLAAMMDPRHLQRFQNEARVAAVLHHTNIVPVYAVGSERGVHYYAMQFIDGRTLAAVIDGLRRTSRHTQPPLKIAQERTAPYIPVGETPSAPGVETAAAAAAALSTLTMQKGHRFFRAAAQLGVQAAEALDHAHQLGVVHRDIKPANLLVDDRGHLWITDFGLAQMYNDTRLTLTGDVVGTLRYMSPEQALAKRAVIDHRADIYSLGVTLYEMLTLRPAIGGENREEMLRKIAFEEPVPPRRLNKAIAVELETIVLKAMAKDPAERYGTAQELADDLRCYLEDHPIRARRPPLWTRLARWGRRHKPLVAGVLAALLMGLTVLAGSIGWVARDRAARRAKNQEVIAAALQASAFWQEQHRLPEALSAAQAADGLLAGADMEEDLRQRVGLRLADLKLLSALENIRLEKMTAVKDGQFDAKGAHALYGKAYREAGLDVEALPAEEAGERIRRTTVAAELAAVLEEWAKIRWFLRGTEAANWKPLLRVAQLADPDEWRGRVRKALAEMDRKALREVAASEEAFHLPAALLSFLGFALWEDKETRGQAETFLREAQRRHPNDFWVNEDLFWFFHSLQPSPGEDAIRFATAAVAVRPQSPGAHNNLGNALKGKGRLDEAIAEYREAIRLQHDFAEAHENLGNALRDKGQLDEAIAEFREATRINTHFAESPTNRGNAPSNEGWLDEAVGRYREAVRFNKDNAIAHHNLGGFLASKGQLDEAIHEFREALRINKDYAEARFHLGLALLKKGLYRQAVDELRRVHELGSQQTHWSQSSAQWLRNAERMADLDARLPALLTGKEQAKDANERLLLACICQLPHKALYAASARWYDEAFAAQPALADTLASDNRYNAACAAAMAGCGQGQDTADLDENKRARLRRQALDWLRADLEAWRGLLAKDPDKARPVLVKQLQHWQDDPDFANVRGIEALGRLPEPERKEWKRLWQEAEALRQRAAAPPTRAAPIRTTDGSQTGQSSR